MAFQSCWSCPLLVGVAAFVAFPQPLIGRNHQSALSNAEFVTEAIDGLVATNCVQESFSPLLCVATFKLCLMLKENVDLLLIFGMLKSTLSRIHSNMRALSYVSARGLGFFSTLDIAL